MQLFRQALERYVPNGLVMHEGESPVTGSPESPGFAFEDAGMSNFSIQSALFSLSLHLPPESQFSLLQIP